MKREVNMRHKPIETKGAVNEVKGVDTVNRTIFTADKDINTDPLGMWTGVPTDPYDEPVQDADDL